MKIAIIANCQTQAISNYMRIISGCSEIVNVPAHLLGTEQYNKALTNLKEIVNDENAVIFTFNLGERFGEISTLKLKAVAKAKVFTITNLFLPTFSTPKHKKKMPVFFFLVFTPISLILARWAREYCLR